MPKVGSKHFPYTAEGRAAAKKEAEKGPWKRSGGNGPAHPPAKNHPWKKFQKRGGK